MAIWALADLHLAFSHPEKNMEVFGGAWIHYTEKISKNWLSTISVDDLILLPGDISWAMNPQVARIDLEWIHALPGTKVLLKGNHDYWWSSLKQVEAILPPSMHLIQNNAFRWEQYVIGGARLWDSVEYSFNHCINFVPNPLQKESVKNEVELDSEKIFSRELLRLEMSLKEMRKAGGIMIAMTHYPPIGTDLKDSRAALLMEKYAVNTCVFGHIHNLKQGIPFFGERNGTRYLAVPGDYLDFMPLRLF